MTRTIFIAAGLALAAALPAPDAQAQAPRTFVSAAGSDSNPCSFAAPCRHFQAAVTATSVGGEVDALDPAGYGPITISQAISIEGQGWSYIAPPAGGNGVTINAVSGKVSIRGVSLNGVGITGTTNGIVFNSGSSLNVSNSVIRNFSNFGILFEPDVSTQLFVSNTLVSDNGISGIEILPNGSGTTTGVFDHVTTENNQSHGLYVLTTAQTVNVTVSDSVSANNTSNGILAESIGAGLVSVMVRNSTVANNGNDGLLASGDAVIRVTRSTITGNTTGWASATTGTPVSTGIVWSYADNNIDGNGSNNSTPGTAIPYH
jgi:hypothetical protein